MYDFDDDCDLDDEMDDFDNGLDEGDEFDEVDASYGMSALEAEQAGFYDGVNDATYDAGMYQGFGMSVDLDELDDEGREAYESGYLDGYQSEGVIHE